MKRAIVLSGGGSKGAYQIGVWKALRKMKIKYDIVTGTSIGSVNGIMMVNEPALASAEQKYNRLSTFDYDNQNKIGNMYWFNFNSMKCVCPLYTLLYNDVLENKKKKDINGNPLVNMFDCIDIFEQYDQTMKEKTHKWEENDIFDSINKGTISHDEVTAHIVNFCPELEDAIAKFIENFKIDIVSLNTKNWKIRMLG